MELRMIEGKVSKDQTLGTTTEDRKAGIGSPLIEELVTSCSITCPQVQENQNTRKSSKNSFEQPPSMNQIEEAVKSGQLSHLVKGIKKEIVKASDTQREEGKKEKGIIPVESPILIISRGEPYTRSNTSEGPTSECKEITFPPVIGNNNSSAPPSIKASKVDSKVPLVGFSGEHSWPIGEVPLEITIGDAPFYRTETLNFVIVRSNSPHNLVLGRTKMQKMGIVVSTIHGAIKFHTTRGIGTVFSMYESDKVREGLKKVKEASPADIKGIFSCMNAEERVIVNDKYPEQTIIIGKQLPKNFKERLRDLLKSNADVFTWTHADMTGIPRTIMVGASLSMQSTS
ncbi:hypothetical protein Tco_1142323 [Tanacetum coccineum]